MAPTRVCACEGHTLDRLLQPTVMAILAKGPMHGYALVEQLKESPLMRGSKPNDTGVYRLLNVLEEQGVVTHHLEESPLGPSKRVYALSDSGHACMKKWISTLQGYQQGIGELIERMQAAEQSVLG
jgi:DNA-binding PadR family transcriptional regulator